MAYRPKGRVQPLHYSTTLPDAAIGGHAVSQNQPQESVGPILPSTQFPGTSEQVTGGACFARLEKLRTFSPLAGREVTGLILSV